MWKLINRQNLLSKVFTLTGSLVILTGCSVKEPQHSQRAYLKNIDYLVKKAQEKRIKEETSTESYQFPITPIVESQQDDSRVIVDMGKILKVWIAPYVAGGTLIAAHSIYTWVKAPRFIAGESVGRGSPNDASPLTPSGNYPMIYRPAEFYHQKPTFSNKELKEYADKRYQVEAHPAKALRSIDIKNNKYNALIRQYLKQHTQTKKRKKKKSNQDNYSSSTNILIP